MKSIAIAIVLSLGNIAGLAQQPAKLSSGYYEELLLGLDQPNGVLTGFYENGTGWDAETRTSRFICSFYLYGEQHGDWFKIVTWWPGDDKEDSINGELGLNADGTVKVLLESEHGGCWNVNHFADQDHPTNLSLDKRGTWTSIRLVKAKRAYFYTKPNEHAKKRTYLIKGNPIRISSNQPGWVEAEYGDERTSRGWMKESDLYDVKPPSTRN
jgi:hypothetical protein